MTIYHVAIAKSVFRYVLVSPSLSKALTTAFLFPFRKTTDTVHRDM